MTIEEAQTNLDQAMKAHNEAKGLPADKAKALTDAIRDARIALSEIICQGAKNCPSGDRPHGYLQRRALTHEGKEFPPIYCIMSLNPLDEIHGELSGPDAMERFIKKYGHLCKTDQLNMLKVLRDTPVKELVARGSTPEEAVKAFNALVDNWNK